MREARFNFTYFFETLVNRILYVAMNLPTIYTTLLTIFVLYLFRLTDQTIILYAALVVGVILKLIFTLTSKQKQLQTEAFTIAVDVAGGLMIVFINGNVFEWIVFGLTILYLLYYAYIMTISYTRLGHTTEDILKDLTSRHDNENKKSKKR